MNIIELDKTKYQGYKFEAKYKTFGAYQIKRSESGFEISYKKFEAEQNKSFKDEIFGAWLSNPIGFGAFEDEDFIGFVEGFHEKWNNRFRISNICIFSDAYRKKGIGNLLIREIEKEAKKLNSRMIVLETQSCNEKAINFYKKNGFEIIGFDLYSYSNNDLEKDEVRIEMGKIL